MIRFNLQDASVQLCAVRLIETDRLYFELGARRNPLSPGVIAWMPGLTRCSAGCVVHRVRTGALGSQCEAWLNEVERQVRLRRAGTVRVYIEGCSLELEQVFLRRGYLKRVELGFLTTHQSLGVEPGFRLREVVTPLDWSLKHAVHQAAEIGPDGYRSDADVWIEMEKRKCATGRMRCYLIERRGAVCGTIGAIAVDGLLRGKNMVVAPPFRKAGVGLASVRLLWQLAEERRTLLGVFGVAGGPGSRLYRRAGLAVATEQLEFSLVR